MDIKIEGFKGETTIGNLPVGSLFIYQSRTVALKSEYRNDSGACECFIIGSGEMFWGESKTANELNSLSVTPIVFTTK